MAGLVPAVSLTEASRKERDDALAPASTYSLTLREKPKEYKEPKASKRSLKRPPSPGPSKD